MKPLENFSFINSVSIPGMSLKIDDDGILHIRYHEGKTIDLKEKMQEKEAIWQITKGIKHPVLYYYEDYVIITKEAKEYCIQEELQLPVLAIAMLVDNFAHQLVADFYFKFYKPKLPYKVFKSQEEATKWLISFYHPPELVELNKERILFYSSQGDKRH